MNSLFQTFSSKVENVHKTLHKVEGQVLDFLEVLTADTYEAGLSQRRPAVQSSTEPGPGPRIVG